MKRRVEFLNLTGERIPKARAVALCQKLFARLGRNRVVTKTRARGADQADLRLVVVGRAHSRRLNSKYRRKDRPTDVLSFGSSGPGEGLGELVLCGPVIRRQAAQHGLSFHEEMDYLIIHGFLHLLGYDHERSRREEKTMMALQDRLFDELSPKTQRKKKP